MESDVNARELKRQADGGQALEHVLQFRPLTISVEAAAAIAGIGRDRAYAQARLFLASRGEVGIPSIREGRYLRVLTRPFLALYGVDLGGSSPANLDGDSPSDFPGVRRREGGDR